ncbi:MAG TPA: hypothetical protein VF846_09705, partial [Thermoanaerobaculia bacterium]
MKRLLLLLSFVLGAYAEPRAINPAEREAVGIVAAFLAHGPTAIHARLAPAAPLRSLAEGDALRELEVRTGPRTGARWTLQTVEGSANEVAFRVTFSSGYEDGLLFRMKGDRVHELLTLAEVVPVERRPLPPPESTGDFRWPKRPPLHKTSRSITPLLISAILLAALAAFVRKARVLLIILALAALGAALYRPAVTPPLPFVELRDLASFRMALARGDDARAPAGNEIAQLWLLQSGAPGVLPRAASSQLAELVRARVALANDKQEEARKAFDRAFAMKPRRDDLFAEAAASLESFRGEEEFRGSRDASIYYTRAVQQAASGNIEEARRELHVAWKLRPRPREELVRDARLFPL